MFNYKNYLMDKLSRINVDEELGLTINISDEQLFAKSTTFEPDSICVVLKYQTADLAFAGIKTQPVQITVLSEQNSIAKVKKLFEVFTSSYNQETYQEDTTFVKQLYNSPTVVTNFQEIGVGYRSLLYVGATLLITENVLDLNDLTIDGVSYEVLNFGLQYSMQPNTQPITGELCESVKSTASLSLTFSFPLTSSTLATKILNIAYGLTNGNTNFSIGFTLGNVTYLPKNYKLTSAVITAAKTQIPSIQVGVML